MARRSPVRVIGSRLLQALPVMLLATFMVFSLLKLVPGDIAVTLAGVQALDHSTSWHHYDESFVGRNYFRVQAPAGRCDSRHTAFAQ